MTFVFGILFTIFLFSVCFGFLFYEIKRFNGNIACALLICILCIIIDFMIWSAIIAEIFSV